MFIVSLKEIVIWRPLLHKCNVEQAEVISRLLFIFVICYWSFIFGHVIGHSFLRYVICYLFYVFVICYWSEHLHFSIHFHTSFTVAKSQA